MKTMFLFYRYCEWLWNCIECWNQEWLIEWEGTTLRPLHVGPPYLYWWIREKIEGISNLNDETDRNGMRMVYDFRKDAIANVVLNKLFKYTQLQTSFSVNNIALVKGRPKVLNLKNLIENFVSHRHEVVIRRTRYELDQAEKKAHILEGLLIALDHLDEVIALIRASKTPEEAKIGLMEKFELSELQAKARLDMRLQKLTG